MLNTVESPLVVKGVAFCACPRLVVSPRVHLMLPSEIFIPEVPVFSVADTEPLQGVLLVTVTLTA